MKNSKIILGKIESLHIISKLEIILISQLFAMCQDNRELQ